jgi:hypothetical protein
MFTCIYIYTWVLPTFGAMLGANDARFGDPLGFRLVQARQVVGGFAPVAFHHHGFPTAVVVDLARPAIVLWATKLGRWTTCNTQQEHQRG